MNNREALSAGDPLKFTPWQEDLVTAIDQAENVLSPLAYVRAWESLMQFADHPEPALEYCDNFKDTVAFTRTLAYDLAYVAIQNSQARTVSEGWFPLSSLSDPFS